MIRNDFVSNSSSSSYIIALTKDEYESIKEYPKTILELVIRNKEYHFSELGDPPDARSPNYLKYGMYYGRPPKNHDINKYYFGICPFIYQQCSEFKLTRDDLCKIIKYKQCCDNCEDNKDCTTKKKIEQMIKSLNEDKIVMCIEIRNTDVFYIDDEDFSKLNDPHVLGIEDNH